MQSNAHQPTVKQVYEKVEHFLDDYEWQEV